MEDKKVLTEIPENNAVYIEDLYVEFNTPDGVVKAVNGVNISIEKGKTLGLVGETGAGKTTTGLAMLNLIPNPPGKITQGEIFINGIDMRSASIKELEKIRGKDISMIFQDPMTSLNPVLTVGDQIAEVISYHEKCTAKEAEEKAEQMLELVGIPGFRAKDYPHQFSGGMKQRVVIAIALACNPAVLIADEPTTALDVTIQAQVLEMMRGLKEKLNTAMLMITHDLGIVAEMCDEVSVIYAGRIVEHGSLEDIFEQTKHPYTEGLFHSLPDITNRTAKLKPIRGLMPDPSNLPKGCAFCPRCDYAMDICKEQPPETIHLSDSHYVACHLYQCGREIGKGGQSDE
ncbi:MAG: ABC transporter ATP-binding protein [Firmicutes bacterium]|nr:ABC transporter ATP-binding protein [Bacillota bacterium]